MNPTPVPSVVKRSLAVHAAIGLLSGALLYLVCVTGALAVFYPDLQRLEQPGISEMARIDPDAAQRAVENLLAREAGQPKTTHLYVHLPVPDLPRTTVTSDTSALHADATGKLEATEEIAWSDFLIALHYALNLPSLIGLAVVGILGVMMLVLGLSGVIALPRIFRDAFRLRARHEGGQALADWHNRLSVWTLPFTIAIALTGAVIGLGSLTVFGIAANGYDGDTAEVYASVFGAEALPDDRPAPIPDVAGPLRYMAREYPGVRVTYAIVHDPLTAGQHVQIVAKHAQRLIFGEYYEFDGNGRFMHTVGLADGELGQQAAASNYDLHFGNFGGLPVKILYFLLGAGLSVVCATGTYIWLGKRRRRGIEEPRLLAAWDAVIWGVPLMLALSFLGRLALGNGAPIVGIFWGGLALLIAAFAAAAPGMKGRRVLQWSAALAILLCVGGTLLRL